MEETKNEISETLSLEKLESVAGGRPLDAYERYDYDQWSKWKDQKHKEFRDAGRYDLDRQFTNDVMRGVEEWHSRICDSSPDSDSFLISDFFQEKYPEYY
ncbi:MAG: hypothetical protein IKE28_01870 [Solobacterium sp.]|nr:hypothetical protein [Solobacterium sp.]